MHIRFENSESNGAAALLPVLGEDKPLLKMGGYLSIHQACAEAGLRRSHSTKATEGALL